jgi:hypothetical protein
LISYIQNTTESLICQNLIEEEYAKNHDLSPDHCGSHHPDVRGCDMACACFALIVTLVIAALVAGIAIGLTYSEIKHLRERVATLEANQAKHLPYKTADEIEEATAGILKAKFENEFRGELLDNALAHLQQARNGNAK